MEREERQFAAVLDDSQEAAALLKRANEAAEREDWKLAIDSLQRIVELPGDYVLRADERTYESARRHAHRKIAALPPAGLEAYRLLYDGEAEARYRRAVEAHDEAALREIIDRFLLTRFGDRAADVLAGWWLDEGHAAAAIGLLRDVLSICPDPQIPRLVLEAKLALATALAGQSRAAEAIVRAWPSTAPVDAAIRARLVALREELPKLQPVSPITSEAWPVLMGNPARTGLMPPVEPSFLDNAPWRATLPRETKGPLDDMYEYQRQTRALPVTQPVTDGRAVVVKCEGRLLALDADTFDPIWQVAPPLQSLPDSVRQRQVAIQANVGGPANRSALLDRSLRAARLFIDYVDGSVTLSHDLAITVARSTESLTFLGQMAMRESNPNVFLDESRAIANQLFAYDVQTGRLRWRCGTSEESPGTTPGERPQGPATELTGPVEFLAPPVPVGNGLLVPYRSASDLYAAVLDPADGSLKRRVYLCGLTSGGLNSFEALHPCVSDGVAYIPTGRGMLIALDTMTWSIRWAVRYESGTDPVRRAIGFYSAGSSGKGWLCSPPIAAAALVLLAPADADYLYAFDRATGQITWRINRRDNIYLLGANSEHAWLVGPDVTQIDIESGRSTWRKAVGPPTGRGAISGNRLYLPTAEHVAVHDAVSGEMIEKLDLPAGHPAFGNLLCWDGNLYNCDLQELRRFPDMVRSYDRAVAAHRQDPSDTSSAIRLAWLEMMRDRPSRVLAALETVRTEPASESARAARLVDHVAHLRVEALLALAAAPGIDVERADSLLQRARQTARSPVDAVRTGLALADRFNRYGKPAEAYRQYAEIAMALPGEQQTPAGDKRQPPDDRAPMSWSQSAPGDVMIDATPGVRQPARLVIADRLVQIEKRLDASQRASLASWLNQMLDAAIQGPGPEASGPDAGTNAKLERVAHIADAGLLGDVGAKAALQLGIWAQQDERHEAAEYHYQDVLRRGAPLDVTAEALARLALVHLAPDELHMPIAAESEIQRLEKEFAAASIPASILEEPSPTASESRTSPASARREQAAAEKGLISGAETARRLRRRIDTAVLEQHRQAIDGLRLGPPGPVAYITQHIGTAPLGLRGPRPEALADTMLMLSNWSEVRAHRVSDGKLLWPATLRLIDESAPTLGLTSSPLMFLGAAGMGTTQTVPRPQGVYDGQIMIVNSATGLHAIGLATGLRLWSRPYRPAPGSYTASNAFLASDQGNLLSLDADGTLMMSRTIDGNDIRWQRNAANPPAGGWAALRVRGDFAVVVDRDLSQASVFRTADGRHLGDAKFQQPEFKEDRRISLVMYDELMCGPGGRAEIVARELATPGVERWRLQCEDDGKPVAVTGLFKPRPDLLGVGCEMGIVKLVNPANGQVILSAKTGFVETGMFEGAITDGVLCMYGTGGAEKNSFKIIAIDAQDGHLLWNRNPEAGEYWSQLQYAYPIDNALLQAASNAIPLARLIIPGADSAGRRPPGGVPRTEQREAAPIRLQLTILDKRTGRSIGRPQTVALPETESMSMIHQVLTWPDRVVVVGEATYAAFRVGPPAQGVPAQESVQAGALPVGGGR